MKITKVEYVSEHKLKLTFGNNEVKIVDLADKIKHAKGIFLPLKDLEFFKKVTIDDCGLSICWPNGADICPDVLYEMGQTVRNKKSTKKKSPSSRRSSRRIKIRSHVS